MNDLSPRFREAMDELTFCVNPQVGIGRCPMNLLNAVQLFDWLFDEGERASTEAIVAYLTRSWGWGLKEAQRVGHTWDVVAALRTLQQVRGKRRTRRPGLRRRIGLE